MELVETILFWFVIGSFLLSLVVGVLTVDQGNKRFSGPRLYRSCIIIPFQLLFLFAGIGVALVAMNFVQRQEGRMVGEDCLASGIYLGLVVGTFTGWIFVFWRKNG
jgi:hypothetical protein